MIVAFLGTWVKNPDVNDWKELIWVMKYLHTTRYMLLTLKADSLNHMQWWVYTSFAIPPDMKSHTGGVTMMGKGAIYVEFTKQKLNRRNLTEAEIVSINDLMPQMLWTRHFMKAQGYKLFREVQLPRKATSPYDLQPSSRYEPPQECVGQSKIENNV
eukprot:15360855-Ditylum_brightwellii.AAC.1